MRVARLGAALLDDNRIFHLEKSRGLGFDITARVLTSHVAVSTSLDIMTEVPIQQHGRI